MKIYYLQMMKISFKLYCEWTKFDKVIQNNKAVIATMFRNNNCSMKCVMMNFYKCNDKYILYYYTTN